MNIAYTTPGSACTVFAFLEQSELPPTCARRVSGYLVALVPYKHQVSGCYYWNCDCEKCGGEVYISATALQDGTATACCDGSLCKGDLFSIIQSAQVNTPYQIEAAA